MADEKVDLRPIVLEDQHGRERRWARKFDKVIPLATGDEPLARGYDPRWVTDHVCDVSVIGTVSKLGYYKNVSVEGIGVDPLVACFDLTDTIVKSMSPTLKAAFGDDKPSFPKISVLVAVDEPLEDRDKRVRVDGILLFRRLSNGTCVPYLDCYRLIRFRPKKKRKSQAAGASKPARHTAGKTGTPRTSGTQRGASGRYTGGYSASPDGIGAFYRPGRGRSASRYNDSLI